MRRSQYAWRVCLGTIALTLNLTLNVLTDSVHWVEAFGTGKWENEILAAITFVVGGIATHLAFDLCFFLALVSTAHFRLGRYADLATDFGGTMLVMLASLVALLAVRVLRIAVARDAVRKTDAFWTGPPLGVVYSTAWAANLTLSTIFYIKGLSAMRRLSASEYHVHPETLRKRDYEARMKARSMHMYHSRNQLMPM